MQTLLHIDGLSKRYGRRTVLRSLAVDFGAGERVLLLGANGSGKSTLLRISAGLLQAQSGTISPRLPFEQLGFAGHDTLLYGQLSVRENLTLSSALYGRTLDIDGAISRWDLQECAANPMNELSRGQQSRAALCRALIHSPRYLLFDEPTSALDDKSCRRFQEIVAAAMDSHQGQTFCVIATHDVERLLPFANRVIWLSDGAIAADSRHLSGSGACVEVVHLYQRGNR